MMVPARIWLAADVLLETGPAGARNEEEREQLAEIQEFRAAFLSCLVFPPNLQVGLFLVFLYSSWNMLSWDVTVRVGQMGSWLRGELC